MITNDGLMLLVTMSFAFGWAMSGGRGDEPRAEPDTPLDVDPDGYAPRDWGGGDRSLEHPRWRIDVRLGARVEEAQAIDYDATDADGNIVNVHVGRSKDGKGGLTVQVGGKAVPANTLPGELPEVMAGTIKDRVIRVSMPDGSERFTKRVKITALK